MTERLAAACPQPTLSHIRHSGHMVLLIFLMLVATGLGVAIVGSVALPAHRDGKVMFTRRGAARLGWLRRRRPRTH